MNTALLPQPSRPLADATTEPGYTIPAFIESNTSAITLDELDRDCIIPTFADLTPTISHQAFAKTVRLAAERIFPNDAPGQIECRVSHQINGRTPDAIHLPANELKESQKTRFYQRMCFCFEIPTISRRIDGQEIRLTLGGTRSLHETNLFARKSPEKFRIFIGFRVLVCSNMMLSCQGLTDKLECLTEADIFQHAMTLFSRFDCERNLGELETLSETTLTTGQFCQFIGRARLYAAMSERQRRQLHLPQLLLGDSLLNAATRGFLANPEFGANGSDAITCWQLMQLLNESAKQSYIDTWPERNRNATEIATGVQRALRGEDDAYAWFLG